MTFYIEILASHNANQQHFQDLLLLYTQSFKMNFIGTFLGLHFPIKRETLLKLSWLSEPFSFHRTINKIRNF